MFGDWARKQFGAKEMDSDDEAEVPAHMQKAKDIQFEVNKKGYFILPPKTDIKTIKGRQRVIRGYIGAVYRASFHWSPFSIFFNLKGRKIHWSLPGFVPLYSSIER
jgi:hypothetical protein